MLGWVCGSSPVSQALGGRSGSSWCCQFWKQVARRSRSSRKDRKAVTLVLCRCEGRNLVTMNKGPILFLPQKPEFWKLIFHFLSRGEQFGSLDGTLDTGTRKDRHHYSFLSWSEDRWLCFISCNGQWDQPLFNLTMMLGVLGKCTQKKFKENDAREKEITLCFTVEIIYDSIIMI